MTEKNVGKGIKAVVFDMDGVIFDTQIFYNESYREAGRHFGVDKNEIAEIIVGTMGVNRPESILAIKKMQGQDFPAEEMISLMLEIFNRRVEKEGLPKKPGVCELLKWLKENGFRTGLASSTERDRILRYLKSAGLESYFDFITGGDKVENGKPAPDIYLQACENMGVDPVETYGVEDSYNGIRSVYNAGMKAIMVPDSLQPTEEIRPLIFRKFDSLNGFLEYLKEEYSI